MSAERITRDRRHKARPAVFVTCDGCSVNNGYVLAGRSIEKIRREAVEFGWTNVGEKDFCPECSKKRKRKK